MPSARNLLVTVFGDAVRPHDAALSVRSLAALLEPLGVTERLVRTSLTRLVGEEILIVTRVDRRSFYGVHPAATALFDRAEQRIYRHPARNWDGTWTLVVIDGAEGTARKRAALRRELEWLGLGTVAPNVLASPVVSAAAVNDVVARTGGLERVLITRAETLGAGAGLSDVELARRCAPVAELAARYQAVASSFEPLVDAATSEPLDPRMSFVARALLIASYRRVVLADPLLPASLLPGEWSGHQAYELVGHLYRRLLAPSEEQLVDVSETPEGGLKPLEDRWARFGDVPV